MSVKITKIMDGPKNVIVQVYISSDGVELNNEVLYDPKAEAGLGTGGGAGIPRFVLEQVVYSFAGFDATIGFYNAPPEDSLMWVLPEGAPSNFDFRPFGGLKDRSAMDGTAQLVMSTSRLADGQDIFNGSLMLLLRKG